MGEALPPIEASPINPRTGECQIATVMRVSAQQMLRPNEVMELCVEKLVKTLAAFPPPPGHQVTDWGQVAINTRYPDQFSDPLAQDLLVYAKQTIRIEKIKQPTDWAKGVYKP